MHPRRYETLILLSPNLGKPELEAVKTKIDGILAQGRGQIVRFEDWGRRRLAYPVKKEIYGNYLLYDYQGQPALAAELERNLKIDEQIFKFLTLVLEKDFTDQRYEEVLAHLAAAAAAAAATVAVAEPGSEDGAFDTPTEQRTSDISDREETQLETPDESPNSDNPAE
ncbi:MAG: 30S ribosomal protein S6 [Deltaproteobacteria bacterium]|jgi:small subunit ribosomal protein S6|nr:30S ribosomal protein S6 [Deltaproteobacteria bacterium]